MMGLSLAAEIISDWIKKQRSILIMGDFDTDGATSTCVCILAIKMIGATQVDYLIPNWFDFGYGLSPEIVAVAYKKWVEMLITVDNWISYIEGKAIPDADAIINSNQVDCSFDSKSIAGVGIAFYLMSALRAVLKECNWYQEQIYQSLTYVNY